MAVDKYELWMSESAKWLAKLEEVLSEHKEPDFYVDYKSVAFAFPTNDPHPGTLDYPIIDYRKFVPWAREQGFDVDMPATDAPYPKHIRFKKQ
ncbi:MAG: hypothetical protein AB2651_07985 [Candidatus Thiodiazotropha sp.]